ncbi:MAG: DUF1549 domain-containing protein, partial [Acidobacteria bacterium]|nr:DUF1549 domain-containing protein [Acidobacteriota bacterium]
MITMQIKLMTIGVVLFSLLGSSGVAPLESYTPRERSHWAYVKRGTPEAPTFTGGDDRSLQSWVKSPIDAFVLERMNREGLRPSPPADRVTLIRRLYFDLIGLPPTPAEVDAFVRDKSPEAWSRLVDRLLESPRYGERWAQHWMDVVRYAESDGFEYDTHRNDAWRYRDYVIRAFNEDRPYDRFVTEQLAGDELRPDDREMLIASGFNRLGALRKNAGNQDVASSRNEVLTEMTNIVGAAFLGSTLGCARCHNHKFDPIRQSDYYRIQAYFAPAFEREFALTTPAEQAEWKAKVEPIEKEIKQVNEAMKPLADKMDTESNLKREGLMRQLTALKARMPAPLPVIHTVVNTPEKRSPIHLLARGEYEKKGASVGMRPLGVLLPEGTPELPVETGQPRAELAKWIVAPDNPLTARVMVNRIWLYHFGRGIVATPNDFGRMGSRPSHPELLDWLANQYVANGFRMKPLHRLILNSSVWQQSSSLPSDPTARELARKKDPENRFYSRFSRQRLGAEQLRDAMLAVAGTLNLKAGGPSVMVPIDAGLTQLLYNPAQWVAAKDNTEHQRRSIYLFAKRNLRLPFMEAFDAPDFQASCARRESSTHAPQALE